MQKRSILTISEVKGRIDTYIAALITERIQTATMTDPAYGALWYEIKRIFEAGGKRIRPYLAYLVYVSYAKNQSIDIILPALAAQEVVHQAMLIHDDIIDRDEIRHNALNIIGAYKKIYSVKPYNTDSPEHFAKSVAILAGDLLISESFMLLASVNTQPGARVKASQILHSVIFRAVGGELLDTEASFRHGDTASPAVIAEEKTASYSFISPLTMGAVLAGASDSEILKLEKIGRNIGIAYQMQDDILGVFGDESVTGKSTTSDLREGKRTGLIERYLESCTPADKTTFLATFGNKDVDEHELIAIREAMLASGILEAEENAIDDLGQEATLILDSLDIDANAKKALRETMKSFRRRSS